jgi:hypothetical protein
MGIFERFTTQESPKGIDMNDLNEQGGPLTVADALDLPPKFNTEEILEILNDAAITPEDLNYLVNTAIKFETKDKELHLPDRYLDLKERIRKAMAVAA